MNNLSIFIDIDQEFDRVLETIAIAGMAGKLKTNSPKVQSDCYAQGKSMEWI